MTRGDIQKNIVDDRNVIESYIRDVMKLIVSYSHGIKDVTPDIVKKHTHVIKEKTK